MAQTKAIALIFLLLVIGQVLGDAEGIDGASQQQKAIDRMRKLAEIVSMLDYTPSGRNKRHEPPPMSTTKLGGGNR